MVHHVWQATPVMQPAKIQSNEKVVSASTGWAKKGLHACEVCGKGFPYASYLARHVVMHSEEKPHVCETCDRGFSRTHHLVQHMRVHTGEKPYVCETCGLTFADSSSRRRHVRTHMR
jgi:uncharacterized Zn-finger protein